MSIQSAIENAQQKVADAYTAASAKGATMPATQNLSNLATTIGSISGGGVDTRGWIPKTIDANGKLVGSSTAPNFTGVTDLPEERALSYCEYNNTSLTGAVNFPALTTVSGSHGMSNAFYNCTGLTSVDLSALTTISGSNAMNYAFSGCTSLTSVDLSALTTISGSNGMGNAFSGCTSLTSVSFLALTTLNGDSAMSGAFRSCTGLTSVNFPVLTTIYNSYAMNEAFRDCTGLTSVSFPALGRIQNQYAMQYAFQGCTGLKLISFLGLRIAPMYNTFSNMLKGVDGCMVAFRPELESSMRDWSDVKNGFGGTNTRVIFGEPKTIQVSIPQGYTVYFNDENITSSTEVVALIGNNNVEGIDNTGRAFKYTFVVDSTTAMFTPDVSGLMFNEFQLTSNYSGVAFEAEVDLGSLTVDANNKVYATAGFSLTVNGTKEGFTSFPTTVSTDSSATVNVKMFADSDIVVLDSSNIVSLASGDTGYLSVDTTNNLIKYGNSTSFITASVQVTLTPPAGTTNMRIMTGAYTSTESGYDYGYISLGTQRVTPSYSNVKNGVIENGSYLFRDSGVNTVFTPVDSGTLDQTNLVLSIGIAEDSVIKGDNMLYIQPIRLFFW